LIQAKNPPKEKPVDLAVKYKRKEVEDLLTRKFFYVRAFEIYGGCSGYYDFGPLGASLKTAVERVWRNHFILEEDMLELNTTNMILYDVLKTSGHVEKFSDFMVRDEKTNLPRRADKLIQEAIQKQLAKAKKQEDIDRLQKIEMDVENYSAEEIDQCIIDLKIKDPDTGNALTKAVPFNLMFENNIGPSGYATGFLRPETAQGIFINFRRLIEYNNGRMPFAGAQIGMGYRNEIAPRQGLLRVREFTMAEIEHFYDPECKTHPKFSSIADHRIPLYSAAD
jgi:glycyl-tRNA synthetase